MNAVTQASPQRRRVGANARVALILAAVAAAFFAAMIVNHLP